MKIIKEYKTKSEEIQSRISDYAHAFTKIYVGATEDVHKRAQRHSGDRTCKWQRMILLGYSKDYDKITSLERTMVSYAKGKFPRKTQNDGAGEINMGKREREYFLYLLVE